MPETVNAVFRAVHSMKGGAGIFALDTLVRFAHIFETALDKVRSGVLAATPPVVKVFLRAADLLADLVRAAREDGSVDEARIAAMGKEFSQIDNVGGPHEDASASQPASSGEEEAAGEARENIWNILFTPYPALYAKANEAAVLLRELRRLGPTETELDSSQLPDLQELDPEGAYLTWRITLKSDCSERDILDLFEFVEDDCRLEITRAEAPGFEPGTVITGENGFKFEFFPPLEPEEEEAEAAPPEPPAPIAKARNQSRHRPHPTKPFRRWRRRLRLPMRWVPPSASISTGWTE